MPLPRSICDTDAVVVSSPTLSRMVAICGGSQRKVSVSERRQLEGTAGQLQTAQHGIQQVFGQQGYCHRCACCYSPAFKFVAAPGRRPWGRTASGCCGSWAAAGSNTDSTSGAFAPYAQPSQRIIFADVPSCMYYIRHTTDAGVSGSEHGDMRAGA
jgi:hypothetical protein